MKTQQVKKDAERYRYEDLLEIVKTLRGENGCPWDREQTHLSLRPEMMEEAAEAVAAIRVYDQTGKDENLVEELGDVLLQVVMHSQIAQDEGRFTIEDVVHGIAAKMVRRHPHVFGDRAEVSPALTSGQVLDNWEEIKRKEKPAAPGQSEGQAALSALREIPPELPALTRAVKVLKKADKLYRRQDDYETAAAKLREAAEKLGSLSPASYDPEITRQIGEILMAASNLSRHCKLAQEQILTDRIEDLIEELSLLSCWRD
ncbi:MAG: MazG family protein [Clostridium sp.]|nr:MazG family protein [Clostridium sp.]